MRFALHLRCRMERKIWRAAFRRHLPLLRSQRDELRDALSHLGVAFLRDHSKLILDVRRDSGPHWFDQHYSTLLTY